MVVHVVLATVANQTTVHYWQTVERRRDGYLPKPLEAAIDTLRAVAFTNLKNAVISKLLNSCVSIDVMYKNSPSLLP
jgi:hypothetical protein